LISLADHSLNPDQGRRPTVTSPPGPERITRSRHHSFKPDPTLNGATAATTRDRGPTGRTRPHISDPDAAMTAPAVDKITLQVTLTRDDYARYVAIANRRNASWSNVAWYAGALFAAVPLALFFESLGRGLAAASADAALIGKFSLFAFLFGGLTMQLLVLILRRLAMRRYVAVTLNPLEPKQVVFDTIGVTMTGGISEYRWRWAAISGLTAQRDLLVLWIGSFAVIVPGRSFDSAAARDAAIAFIRARKSDAASAAPTPAA
jgi:hypothetical protein